MAAALNASLCRFYRDPYNADVLEKVVTGTSPLTGKCPVSLRLVEWYVNYDKAASKEYHAQLKAYTRRLFDPFRRQARIVVEGRGFDTTIGQMNFFKWLIEEGHWERILANHVELNAIMLEQSKDKRDASPSKADAKPAKVAEPVPEHGVRFGSGRPMTVLFT
jgi:hypothetical protein